MYVARRTHELIERHVRKSRSTSFWALDLRQSFSAQVFKGRGKHTAAHAQGSRSQQGQLLPQQTDLLDVYRSLVSTGRIQCDEDQIRVVMELRRLQKTLQGYSPPAFALQYYTSSEKQKAQDGKPWYSSPSNDEVVSANNTLAIMKLRSRSEALAELQTPKGLLLTGPPGCGKSFLIDLWLSVIPTPYKIRKHYNELVLEMYRGVWEESKIRTARVRGALPDTTKDLATPWTKGVRDRWRRLLKAGSLPALWNPTVPNGTLKSHGTDPSIPFVIAHRLILQHWLLVFDELQLLDVSSAGLLSDVLSWFWRMGGVLIATSNKVPDDLYKKGVQKERLEPFVEALKVRCPVHVMRGEKDWRRTRSREKARKTWFTYAQNGEFELEIKSITDSDSASTKIFRVFGRQVRVPWSTGSTCKFTFSQLCEESLGPADYLTIASNYKTVAITHIPILKISAKNHSRRFISLIDSLYEARCRIIALAESQPDGLFFPDAVETSFLQADGTMHEDQIMAEAISESREAFRPNVLSYENTSERPAASPLSIDSLSIFSGEEERFAYSRALSRLVEMTSPEYAKEEEWNPLSPSLRKWENRFQATQDNPVPYPSPSNGRLGSRVPDFALEATFESEAPSRHALRERPSAPRLKEDHIWGVRDDWGPKAGAWGKGPKVYQKDGGPRTRPDDRNDVGKK